MIEFQTCPHFDRSSIRAAISLVCKFEDKPIQTKNSTYCCLHCGLQGMLSNVAFKQHFQQQEHYLCVRLRDPAALYCFKCCDFQYSTVFDKCLERGKVIPEKADEAKAKLNDEEDKTSVIPFISRVKGFNNMGSTCFMSSVVQVLMCNPYFNNCKQLDFKPIHKCEKVIRKDDKQNNTLNNGVSCIPCEYKRICAESESNVESITPAHLLYAVWGRVDAMASYSQQDAHEFFLGFTNGIESQLQELHSRESITTCSSALNSTNPTIIGRKSPRIQENQKKIEVSSNNSVSDQALQLFNLNYRKKVKRNRFKELISFTEIFAGELESKLSCVTCGHSSSKTEVFKDLSLSVDETINDPSIPSHLHFVKDEKPHRKRIKPNSSPSSSSSSNSSNDRITEKRDKLSNEDVVNPPQERMNLKDCMKYYTSVETLGEKLYCEKCGQQRETQKKLSISTAPPVLVLHLKRFDILKQRKITTKVDFPLSNFDISEFMIEPDQENDDKTQDFITSTIEKTHLDSPIKPDYITNNENDKKTPYILDIENIDIQQEHSNASTTHDEVSTSTNGSNIRVLGKDEETIISCLLSLSKHKYLEENFLDDKNNNDQIVNMDIEKPIKKEKMLKIEKPKNTYDLQGIVSHAGSLHGGHYISYIVDLDTPLGEQSTWLKCDDETISHVSEQEVSEVEGYLLFYVRKETS